MNEIMIIDLVQQALYKIIILSAPSLLAGLTIGVLISFVQAVTQIQEMTLTFVPKMLIVFVTISITTAWMIQTMVEFTTALFNRIPMLVS